MKRVAIPVVLFVLAAALVVTGTLLLTHPRAKDTPANDAVVYGSGCLQNLEGLPWTASGNWLQSSFMVAPA